jgi:hypothetical protein
LLAWGHRQAVIGGRVCEVMPFVRARSAARPEEDGLCKAPNESLMDALREIRLKRQP